MKLLDGLRLSLVLFAAIVAAWLTVHAIDPADVTVTVTTSEPRTGICAALMGKQASECADALLRGPCAPVVADPGLIEACVARNYQVSPGNPSFKPPPAGARGYNLPYRSELNDPNYPPGSPTP